MEHDILNKGAFLAQNEVIHPYSFAKYMDLTAALISAGKTSGNDPTPYRVEMTKLNLYRMQRVAKTMRLLPAWDALEGALSHVRWTILSEVWCGDSAQITPALQAIAEKTGADFQILLRDENPYVMDAFLFRGTRSIPRLICTDKSTDEVLAVWGPRPEKARQFVERRKAEGADHVTWAKELQNWYNQDKTISLQYELLDLIKSCML